MSDVAVHRVPVLRDNYSFIVEDRKARTAAIVDPPVVHEIVDTLATLELRPLAIWITHHHSDHVAGVEALQARFGGLPVYASSVDSGRIPGQTHKLNGGDQIEFAGKTVDIFFVPGHANGHIAYYLPEGGHVFSGDVVFGASCGKIFEGTAEQMFTSVARIASLPESTKIWCGHEYTLGNLKFASRVEPENQATAHRLAEAKVPTIPLEVGTELRTNPFMRCDQLAVQRFTGETDPLRVFARLREIKDQA